MTKRKTNESLGELADMAERDHEVQMARAQLYKLAKYAINLHDMLKGVSEAEGIEGWQQAKITKASDYISSVYHSLDYEKNVEDKNQINAMAMAQAAKESTDPYKSRLHGALKEKAMSKAQQQAAGIALAAKKKGEKPKGKGAAASMAKMSKKDLKDFAGTKHKGLPKKKTNETIDATARRMLGEGTEYELYLMLNEAPMGNVINKLKSGLSKLPTQAAKKATSLIKKVPKSAWPIAAGVILSMAGADPAAAGDLSTLADGLEKLEQLARELGPTAGERAAAAAGSAADVAQGAAEISMDQLKQANRMLGGGDANTIKELIQNGVDLDKVKSLLDKFDVTDSLDISQSLQQIEGNNLVPMIQWIQRMY